MRFGDWLRRHGGSLARLCNENRILTCCVVLLALSVFFALVPALDRAVTRLFYVPGQGFPMANSASLLQLRLIGSVVPVAVGIAAIAALVLKLLFPHRPCLFPPRFTLFFATLYFTGPVLLVNGVFKSFWGRPRPVKVEEFGGSYPFVEAWSFGQHIFSHRSFISGEAAAIACLLPLALFVARAWRAPVLILLAGVVAAVSTNRIAFGGHFLSDVVISIALVVTLAVALHQVMFVAHAARFADGALEAELTRIGLSWRARTRRDLQALAGWMDGLARRAARTIGAGA